jgi:hypothetical protein
MTLCGPLSSLLPVGSVRYKVQWLVAGSMNCPLEGLPSGTRKLV